MTDKTNVSMIKSFMLQDVFCYISLINDEFAFVIQWNERLNSNFRIKYIRNWKRIVKHRGLCVNDKQLGLICVCKGLDVIQTFCVVTVVLPSVAFFTYIKYLEHSMFSETHIILKVIVVEWITQNRHLYFLWKYKQEVPHLNAICIMIILFNHRQLF